MLGLCFPTLLCHAVESVFYYEHYCNGKYRMDKVLERKDEEIHTTNIVIRAFQSCLFSHFKPPLSRNLFIYLI